MLQQADLFAALEGRRHDHAGLRREQPAGRHRTGRALARRRRRSAGVARAPGPLARPRDAATPTHRRAALADRRHVGSRCALPRLVRRRRGRDRRARVHRGRPRRRATSTVLEAAATPASCPGSSAPRRRPAPDASPDAPGVAPGGGSGRVPGRQHAAPTSTTCSGPWPTSPYSGPELSRPPVDLQ